MPCHDFREPRHGFAKSTSCILLKWSLLYFDTYWGDPYYEFRHNIVTVAEDPRGSKGEWICRLLWLMRFIVNNRTDGHWNLRWLWALCARKFLNFAKSCVLSWSLILKILSKKFIVLLLNHKPAGTKGVLRWPNTVFARAFADAI